VRRITIELKNRPAMAKRKLTRDKPLRQGRQRRTVAELYLRRWTIERAFHELDQALHGEIETLGYPGAALLSFCVALLAYNVISVVKTALAATHGSEMERRVSPVTIWPGTGSGLPRNDDCRSVGRMARHLPR